MMATPVRPRSVSIQDLQAGYIILLTAHALIDATTHEHHTIYSYSYIRFCMQRLLSHAPTTRILASIHL